jgi:hypothetical protein
MTNEAIILSQMPEEVISRIWEEDLATKKINIFSGFF